MQYFSVCDTIISLIKKQFGEGPHCIMSGMKDKEGER